MSRAISNIFALFIGFLTLLFGLILAIPLTIVALITGKKLQKDLAAKQAAFNAEKNASVFEGEYEHVSK